MTDGDRDSEACGRCAMSSVAEVMDDRHDPFDGERIELEETTLRKVSPGVVVGRVKRRIDDVVRRVTFGR